MRMLLSEKEAAEVRAGRHAEGYCSRQGSTELLFRVGHVPWWQKGNDKSLQARPIFAVRDRGAVTQVPKVLSWFLGGSVPRPTLGSTFPSVSLPTKLTMSPPAVPQELTDWKAIYSPSHSKGTTMSPFKDNCHAPREGLRMRPETPQGGVPCQCSGCS